MNKKTLIEAFEGVNNVDQKGITFIHGIGDERFISYKDFVRKAKEISRALARSHLGPGDEAVFQIEDEETFLTVFWACLMRGIIPVPLTPGNSEENIQKIVNVWACLNHPFLLVTGKRFEKLKQTIPGFLERVKPGVIVLDRLNPRGSAHESPDTGPGTPTVSPDDPAFIQFSSGSTGEPKGVILTHQNLLANITGILTAARVKPEDSSLSWMPLTHDMGIIGFHLTPLVHGIDQFIIPTPLFIRQPLLWIKKIHEHRITNTSSPNFGYKHFLTHYRRSTIDNLDLSCVKIIFNGGEPISDSLCSEFLEEMSRFGLKKEAMLPSYGLAEASLAVTFPGVDDELQTVSLDRFFLSPGQKVKEVDRSNPRGITLVELGSTLTNTAVRIAGADDCPLGENIAGYIQIKGDSVTRGYYNNPAATKNAITNDGWLRTGDQGFIRNNRLVWTGRTKDIIFNNGNNFYSHDLERVVDPVNGLELGKTAASGIWNKTKQQDDIVFFVQYRKKNLEEFADRVKLIKHHISQKLGLNVNQVVPVCKIPKTTSGKIQRFKLAQRYKKGEFSDILNQLSHFMPEVDINADLDRFWREKDKELMVSIILKTVENILGYRIDERDKNFSEMGVDSLNVPRVKMALEDLFHLDLPVSLALDYPTVDKMADYMYGQLFHGPGADGPVPEKSRDVAAAAYTGHVPEPIAVIGVGCRFPGGADTPGQYWDLLEKGLDPIIKIPGERWDSESFYDSSGEIPGKSSVHSGGFLSDVDRFDALFFGITPVEAEALDPQQRLLLEISYEAMENAGLNINRLEGSRTGVFIGISNHDYIERMITSPEDIGRYAFTGSMLSTASGRISYTFGFQGPSMSIDTACSSSAVAVNQAAINLHNRECDLALAGGVNLILSPKGYIGFSRLNVLAPDGRCKSFDDSADGYGRSEGCGIIVLKRLSEAFNDGDPVLALVLGSAVNHDGKSSGLTVPNGLAQEQVIRRAQKNAGIAPGDVGYLEAHGSGTKLGDLQEINALVNVFKDKPGAILPVGSVKSNIGHTESAAGIAGIIKVILALNKPVIPKNLHFKNPNSYIQWDNGPIRVAAEHVEWGQTGSPRIAGISSFSLSGTNAHVILQEAPPVPEGRDALFVEEKEYHIFTLSTKPPADLLKQVRGYIPFLTRTEEEIANICYTSNISRTGLEQRFAMVADSDDDLSEMLTRYFNQPGRLRLMTSIGQTPPKSSLVFMFTGQGSIYPGIGRELYSREPVFKEAFDRCDSLFRGYTGNSLRELLYEQEADPDDLRDPIVAQPVIFTIEYALYRLWRWWGLEPSAVVGHSIGEYAAAHAAGVFSLEDAVKLVALRGRVMTSAPREGKMVGILTREDVIRPMLEPYNDVSVAAVNAPDNITVSGKESSVNAIVEQVKRKGVFVEHLDISHAFHSSLMVPFVDMFRDEMESIRFSSPHIPFISTITGQHASAGDICSPDYWSRHISKTVRFHTAMKTLQSMGYYLFVELGGTATLAGLAGQCIADQQARFIPSLRNGRHACEHMYGSLAKLYLTGADIDWEHVHAPFARRRKKVLLPNYRFQRERFWIDVNEKSSHSAAEVPAEPDTSLPGEFPIADTPAASSPATVHLPRLKGELREIINMISGLKPEDIGDETDLFSFGLDSLMLLEFKDMIQKKYGIDIALNEFLMDLSTVKNVSEYIAAAQK